MMMKNLYKYRDYLLDNPLLKALQTWKFTAFLLVVLSMQSHTTLAQSTKHKVSGKVTSTVDNQGIPGVSILIKGTTAGTATDIDGNFSIEAADTDVLTVSYIGYHSQEVSVGAKTTIDISLVEDIARLSEVVVVGYGLQKRTDVSSAQTTVTAADIQRTTNTTIEQAIQGRAAGVYVTQNTGQPGGGISVNIRGVNSLNGASEPLYVIDGIQIQADAVAYGTTSSTNPLAGLNPSDIESMEILQGPSATAIYGSRATNGVVLITTKRGKAGETRVTYGYTYILQDKPKELPTMNLREYAQMVNEYRTLTGGTPPAEFQDLSLLGEGSNWQRALFKTAPLNKHQLSLSGGSEKTQFYLSGEYFKQEGVAIGSSFKRASTRLNIDNQTRKWLKIGTNLSFSQTNEELSTTQEGVISTAIQSAPNQAVFNPNGSYAGPPEGQQQFAPLNPVAIAELIKNPNVRRALFGGFNIEVSIIKGLKFRNSINGNLEFRNTQYFVPTYDIGARSNSIANLSETRASNTSWNWNQLLQYNIKIGRHDIGAMVSHESQETNYESISAARSGFVTNTNPVIGLGNATGATNGGNKSDWAMESYLGRLNYTFADKYIVQAAIRADGSARFGANNRWGTFPSVSAAWRASQEPFMKNIPFINELKLRVETGITGNQGNISFYAPLGPVTTIWGTGFNAARFGNPNMKWEETKTNNLGFNLGLFQNRIQLEGDIYVKNTDGLLMPAILPDYMGTSGEGSIAPPQVNIGSLENKGWAFTLITNNIDKGDFTWKSNFNISGFKTKITKFNSETAILDRTAWYMNSWTQRSVVGQAPWLFRGYIQEGVFQSLEEIEASALPTRNGVELPVNQQSGVWVGDAKFRDINQDGKIDQQDITNIGNPWPKFSLGFTNTISFKGIELMVLLTGSYGNDVYNYMRFQNVVSNGVNTNRGALKEAADYAKVAVDDAGKPYLLNPETSVPRISAANANGNGQRFTSNFVEDGSYLRIKNLQLGYNIPKALVNKVYLQGARVTIGVQNLATFTKYKGYDPEIGAFVGRDVQSSLQSIGLDYGRYPMTKMYTVSVGIDF